ncbi:MAG: Fic family protein [Gammaproteobacteria bacterium]|nr:Fic family protein [Gammaproteobacteria bacterium]MXW46721.1 Fic family protein [Gammaproteobacteria bacterium]MYD03307.1 Fic family protein [Gammaproteobacteria bacterium]MYI24157.1 Fic family protein [Gammaproteobacteria bacterium]
MPPVHYHEGRFPPDKIEWAQLIPLLGPAAAAVARYDGMLAAVPNPGVLLAPLSTQEAVLSSRIEGTQATMEQVLEFEAGRQAASSAIHEDIQEILNYRSAMLRAEQLLANLPLSQRVIREAHKVLLAGVRGQNKAPGDYRRIPNWIGAPGCTIETATFVPIAAEQLPDGMSAWERFIHDDQPDRLAQLAILHAEFEALHPFLDGNGRLGRMLVPLFLWQKGLIRRPTFYISAYFEARRDAYYGGLLAVSRDNDWTGWCRFFLDAVRTQAEDNLAKAQQILALYEEMKRRIPAVTRSRHAVRVLDWLFERPIFSSSNFIDSSSIPERTARRLLKGLQDDGVVRVISEPSGQSAAILIFPPLLNIVE